MIITGLGLLLDMDGVILATAAGATREWRSWAEDNHFDPDEVAAFAHGRRTEETVRHYLGAGSTSADLMRLHRRFETMTEVVALPGAAEILNQEHLPVTVVTSATARTASRLLPAAGLRVPPQMVTADDVVRGKPDPECYQKGAAAIGLAPALCIAVEDSPAGAAAALAAGCVVIGIGTTHGPDLPAVTACVPDLSHLQAVPDGICLRTVA